MKQDIKRRRYKLLVDFTMVHSFLTDIYTLDTLNSYLLPQFFEYAHTHPFFSHKLTHRFGLWENNDKLVGVACFEMNIGDASHFMMSICRKALQLYLWKMKMIIKKLMIAFGKDLIMATILMTILTAGYICKSGQISEKI